MKLSKVIQDGLERYNPEELADIAIKAAPVMTMPALRDLLYDNPRVYRDHISYMLCPEPSSRIPMQFALNVAFLKAFNPLEDRILDLTSVHSDELKPAYNGVIWKPEIIAMVRNIINKYYEFMKRIICCHTNIELYPKYELLYFNYEDSYRLIMWENVSRCLEYRSALLDLATTYKNHIGLDYPDCKGVSVFVGCTHRAKNPDPAFIPVVTSLSDFNNKEESEKHRKRAVLVEEAGLFDKWKPDFMVGEALKFRYHYTYLSNAIYECGLSDEEAKDAMFKCRELRDAIKDIVIDLPLVGKILQQRNVRYTLLAIYVRIDRNSGLQAKPTKN